MSGRPTTGYRVRSMASGTDWTALGAIATAVAALFTAAAAGATAWMARKTRDMATGTSEMAVAAAASAASEAETLNATRLDRELACRPVLTLKTTTSRFRLNVNDVGSQTISLRNIGSGPALRCHFVLRLEDSPSAQVRSEPVDLPAQSGFEAVRFSIIMNAPSDPPTSDDRGWLACSDILHFEYRFPVRRVGDEIWVDPAQITRSQAVPKSGP